MKILKSLLPLVLVVALFYFASKIGFSTISKTRNELDKLNKDISIINDKFRILVDSRDSISDIGDALIYLFPSQNPAAIVISQTRSLATTRSVLVTNIKSGGESKDKTGLSRVDISFDVEGQRSDIVNFLKDFGTILPLTYVEKAKINELGGVSRATVNIKSFWSSLPQKLPALTESISSLSNEENQVLSELPQASLL